MSFGLFCQEEEQSNIDHHYLLDKNGNHASKRVYWGDKNKTNKFRKGYTFHKREF